MIYIITDDDNDSGNDDVIVIPKDDTFSCTSEDVIIMPHDKCDDYEPQNDDVGEVVVEDDNDGMKYYILPNRL